MTRLWPGHFCCLWSTVVNNFAAGVAIRSEDCPGCGLGGRVVVALEHVGVDLEGDRGIGVAEPGGHHMHRHAGAQTGKAGCW